MVWLGYDRNGLNRFVCHLAAAITVMIYQTRLNRKAVKELRPQFRRECGSQTPPTRDHVDPVSLAVQIMETRKNVVWAF